MINITAMLIAILIIALIVAVVLSLLKKATKTTIYLAVLALVVIGGFQLIKIIW
jgi:hypothetical protein